LAFCVFEKSGKVKASKIFHPKTVACPFDYVTTFPQDVSHVAFTDDGSHFVSCGADGNTFVWSLLGATVAHKMPGT
jgi:WD40 repeat protein